MHARQGAREEDALELVAQLVAAELLQLDPRRLVVLEKGALVLCVFFHELLKWRLEQREVRDEHDRVVRTFVADTTQHTPRPNMQAAERRRSS